MSGGGVRGDHFSVPTADRDHEKASNVPCLDEVVARIAPQKSQWIFSKVPVSAKWFSPLLHSRLTQLGYLELCVLNPFP